MTNILITGGAGFIGTHLTRRLLKDGHNVTILDSFHPQIHGDSRCLPADIAEDVHLIEGDVADVATLRGALAGVQAVVHLAAETGTGQSMYEVSRYERTNLGGTAALYDLLAKNSNHCVKRIVIASSRAIYGEGAYCCAQHGMVYPLSRSTEHKRLGEFDPVCPVCSGSCEAMPTPETAPLQSSSFYGLTKQVQEQMAMMFGRVLGIPTIALRFQNVYGPGQALENPYTGILAIFSNLARRGERIRVFEDGAESRDFVYVEDVARATSASLTVELSGCHAFNVGSNQRTSVLEVANVINSFYGNRSEVEVTGAFRDGDIRHGLADLTEVRKSLGYEPQWEFREGIRKFLEWANQNESVTAGYERSLAELRQHGLFHER